MSKSRSRKKVHNSGKNAFRVVSLDSIGCSFNSEHIPNFKVYMITNGRYMTKCHSFARQQR